MIDLYNDTTGELIGQITEADLQVLVDALEEESTQDRDYFIDAATIDVIADGRATEHLVALLRNALGSKTAWTFGGSAAAKMPAFELTDSPSLPELLAVTPPASCATRLNRARRSGSSANVVRARSTRRTH
jgi:hypothetical protein